MVLFPVCATGVTLRGREEQRSEQQEETKNKLEATAGLICEGSNYK